MNTLREGLKPLPKDERDFKMGAIFTKFPKVEDLPDEYRIGSPLVRDQGSSDFCTQYASCAISEIQEGTPLSAEYAFALAKEGDKDSWGDNLRNAAKSQQYNGTIALSDAPYTMATHNDVFLRNIQNWDPELRQKAQFHRKQSYFVPEGASDTFDSIRVSMWKFRQEKVGAMIGVLWEWDIKDTILKTIPTGGFGHAMAVIGWKDIEGKPYLIVQNSAGTDAGDNGVHYISRNVINEFTERYGCYMYLDLEPEKAKWYLENGITDKDNWVTELIKVIIKFIKDILS